MSSLRSRRPRISVRFLDCVPYCAHTLPVPNSAILYGTAVLSKGSTARYGSAGVPNAHQERPESLRAGLGPYACGLAYCATLAGEFPYTDYTPMTTDRQG